MKTNILRWTVQIHETTSKFLNGNHQDKADAYNAIVRLKKEPHPSSMNAQLVGAEKAFAQALDRTSIQTIVCLCTKH